jgi:hypothetical protein
MIAMPLKVILNVDPETGEADNFIWTEDEEPPPIIRPKIKKRSPKDGKQEEEKPS